MPKLLRGAIVLFTAATSVSLALLVVGPVMIGYSLPASSGTFQDFDVPSTGTPYITATHFDPPEDRPAELMDGGPTMVGKFIRLAYGNSEATQNSLSFERTDTGTPDQVVADFDFRIQPGTGRADGFGFTLLNTANYDITGTPTLNNVAEEPDFADSLGIGFDIYQSIVPTLELNNNHISVHFNGTLLKEFDATPALDLASGQWIHARIIMRSGEVTVTLTQCGRPSSIVVDRFSVPGLVPYESRVHFAARTGGELSDQDVDNVHVQSLSLTQSVLNFSTGCYSVVETEGEVLLTVTRTGPANGTVTVPYSTIDNTALAGSDYIAISGALMFESGQTTKTISVTILDNGDTESDKSFLVSLGNPASGTDVISGPSTAKVTILDDETYQTGGNWSDVIPLPIIPIQMQLLPTGKVMLWDRSNDASEWDENPRLWDPVTEMITATATVTYELFCSGHSFLPDGRLLVTGGHIEDAWGDDQASIYNPFTDSWTRLPKMNLGRWYPSNVTLPDGDVLVLGGSYTPTSAVNRTPQVWETSTNSWRDLNMQGNFPDYANYYPFLYVAPNGKVFNAGPQQMARYLDTSSPGTWTDVASSTLEYRDYGSSVMYDDGKVLIVGGNPRDSKHNNPTDLPSDTAEVIDLNDSNPTWQLVQKMNFRRRQHNATLLPDGTVLVTGGSSAAGFDNPDGAVLEAEMWDPSTEMWTVMSAQTRYRGYHSTALLLPDGRVLVGGGGHPDPTGGAQYNFEIYSPPYLFKGPRPTITLAPAQVVYNQAFFVKTSATISSVNWIALSAVTHSFNQNQRINRLSFGLVPGGLSVNTPSSANLAPPGYYMLFIVDDNGVPSVAQFIQVLPQVNTYLPLINKN